jgi:UDP-glucose-4-epimerase GalE
MTLRVLVTGGAGFIGSHFVRAARERGFEVLVIDDLSTGRLEAVPAGVTLVRGDIADHALVRSTLQTYRVDAIAHFASKIVVAESVANPRLYFDANVTKSLSLLDVAAEARIDTFLFSSSASVYAPSDRPLTEDAALSPQNPYGMTKLAVEHALAAYGAAYGIRWAALRYFNAAGAHPDGSLRECHDPETHLIPLAVDAALGRTDPVTVFGDDYPTPDGTCIRDYVHVCDLADAHLAAIDVLHGGAALGCINLGTGAGFSVRQVIDACSAAVGRDVPHRIGPRRAGDPTTLVADARRARERLGWWPRRRELSTIIEDALRSRRA